jgi:hypothetical protein
MTEPTIPAYSLTSLTDKQWDKQLASQEKMKAAELANLKEVELEKLRNQRELARGRRQSINMFFGGLAALLAFLALIGSLYYGVQRGGERQHDLGVQCVQSGGVWEEHEGRDGDRCKRP